MTRRASVVAVFSLAALCGLPPPASAGLRLSDDLNVSVRRYADAGKVEKDGMAFFWERELAPGAASFTLAASCTRANVEPFEFVGNNKIVYKDVELEGQDSSNTLSLPNMTMKLKDGNPKKAILWDLSNEVRTLFSNDSVVLVSATVIWKGTVDAQNVLSCTLTVFEGAF